MTLTKELSQFAGRTVSSPLGLAISNKQYNYDAFIGNPGFYEGFVDRIIKAGSLDKISPEDRKLHDICEKSREIAEKMGSPFISAHVGQEIINELVEQGLLVAQLNLDEEYP